MTLPLAGGVPARRSVFEAPAVPPAEQTPEQQEQYVVAQIAAIATAAGAAKVTISTATTLALLPLLRSIDPFNAVEVAQFAKFAAERVEAARQEMAKTTWAATKARMDAFGVNFDATYRPVIAGRATKLDVAYERPAAAYRKRMAAGFKSISNLITQAEEERFQQLGGAEAAQQRTGESNAEVEGTKRPLAEGKSKSNTAASSGKRSAGSSDRSAGGAAEGSRTVRSDPNPDADPDDFDPEDPAADEARERQLDAEFDAEQELRDQARLADEEKRELLAQRAQQDMEERMERMVNDDIAMAKRDAHHDALKNTPARVTGYRRVVHPELAETGVSCGLCIAASTRIYKKSDLMPIHNLCNCEAVEIVDGLDPGDQINAEDQLSTLYAEAGNTSDGRALKEQRYTVFDHPELGPVLRNEKHSQRAIKFSAREASEAHKERSKAERKAMHEKRAEKFGTSTGRANA